MKNRVIAGSLLVATLLSGCAGTGRGGDKSYSDDPAYQKLQETAKNIQQSLTQLAEAEQYEKMKNRPSQPRIYAQIRGCLLYTSPSPRDRQKSRMPSSA